MQFLVFPLFTPLPTVPCSPVHPVPLFPITPCSPYLHSSHSPCSLLPLSLLLPLLLLFYPLPRSFPLLMFLIALFLCSLCFPISCCSILQVFHSTCSPPHPPSRLSHSPLLPFLLVPCPHILPVSPFPCFPLPPFPCYLDTADKLGWFWWICFFRCHYVLKKLKHKIWTPQCPKHWIWGNTDSAEAEEMFLAIRFFKGYSFMLVVMKSVYLCCVSLWMQAFCSAFWVMDCLTGGSGLQCNNPIQVPKLTMKNQSEHRRSFLMKVFSPNCWMRKWIHGKFSTLLLNTYRPSETLIWLVLCY